MNATAAPRNFGLDLFRAVAILLVVLSHGSFLLDDTPLDGFPFFKTVDGVDLFFVLSGFLIGGILLSDIEKFPSFGIGHTFSFWKRRWFRTLPNYYLILAVNHYIVSRGIIKEDITHYDSSFLYFFQNFNKPFTDFFWESWSLSVEEWFYVITPLFLILLLRLTTPKRAFLSITLLLLTFSVVWRYLHRNPQVDEFWFDVSFRKVVLCRLDSIAFGLLAAWIHRFRRDLWTRMKGSAAIVGAVLLYFVSHHATSAGSLYRQVILLTLTPLSAMLLLPWAEQLPSLNNRLARVVTHISKISYSMYLVNLALVAEVIRDNFLPQNSTDAMIKYGLYWLAVILLSTLLYRGFEKPMMDLRDRL